MCRSLLLLPNVSVDVELGEEVEEEEAVEHGVCGEEPRHLAVSHQQAQQERHDEHELRLTNDKNNPLPRYRYSLVLSYQYYNSKSHLH
jgi:hypothetical protein